MVLLSPFAATWGYSEFATEDLEEGCQNDNFHTSVLG